MSKEIDEQHGFHWAKSPALGWIIVEFFTPDSWYVPGDPHAWSKSDFTEIDERRIVREEDNTELSDTCKYCGKPLPNDADERYYHQNNECSAIGTTERTAKKE